MKKDTIHIIPEKEIEKGKQESPLENLIQFAPKFAVDLIVRNLVNQLTTQFT